MGDRVVCPSCGAEAQKVLYAGLPMKSCDACSNLWGFWSFVPALWFNGWLFPYQGPYLLVLWDWLKLDWGRK